VLDGFQLDNLTNGFLAQINDARGRCTLAAARPALALGRVCATSAIEYTRLDRAAAPAPAKPVITRRGLRSYLTRLGLWVKHPPARLASLAAAGKRLFPERLKSAVKRALGVP
jgi:hypothetical protein